jgi:hypothetical protein
MSKFTVPRNTVARHLRDAKGNHIGLAAAFQGPTGEVTVGWSYIAKADRKQGSISKNKSWEIAYGRAVSGTNAKIPRDLIPLADEVRERAVRYFRVDDVTIV